jgi:endophilin-B
LIESGGTFGSDGAYGSALIKTGQAEQRLGQCERDFIANTGICFIQPLKKFLDGEMRTITKEKGVLEAKRLDLDAAKSRVRKARSLIGTQSVSNTTEIANLLLILTHLIPITNM